MNNRKYNYNKYNTKNIVKPLKTLPNGSIVVIKNKKGKTEYWG